MPSPSAGDGGRPDRDGAPFPFPGACIVLSTSTETGQEMARKLVTDATVHIYYPLDIPCVVRKVLDLVRPDCFVPVETEIWPNFIRLCRARGRGS